jgi:RND family efflux transporter MFP subunit
LTKPSDDPGEKILMNNPFFKRAPTPLHARRWLHLVVIGILATGSRLSAAEASLPVVPVSTVVRQDVYQELTIPAEFRPYQEVELDAKVSGYLRSINVDFGCSVKAGDLLATLEVPELQAELDQALAAEQRAEAAHVNASLNFARLKKVGESNPNLIAQQDIDTAQAQELGTAAAVTAAKADGEKYRTLLAYSRITAPFDGVITQRYVDPGALVTAGSGEKASPLLRISENQRLRLDFPVPVSYAGEVAEGDLISVRLEGEPVGFEARITRFTRRVDRATRTMETEAEIPNSDLKLIPGSYATVVLKLHRHAGALTVPIAAIGSHNSPSVMLVNAHGLIEERPVVLGLEMLERYEVLSGLADGDRVIIGSRAGLSPGQKVEAKTVNLSYSS